MSQRDIWQDNSMIFKYYQYQTKENETIYRPTIPIVFKNGKHFIFTDATIDSGADFSILSIEMAKVLDIKLDHRSKKTIESAGGNTFTVYPSPISIEHIIRQKGFRTLKWKALVYFSEIQPTILLGQKGFLDKLIVTLDGRKKEVRLDK